MCGMGLRRVDDWDEQKLVLDIPDPYLLFCLRWSGPSLGAGGMRDLHM
jgi:hypothetical protein